jgi:hypothetical protein
LGKTIRVWDNERIGEHKNILCSRKISSTFVSVIKKAHKIIKISTVFQCHYQSPQRLARSAFIAIFFNLYTSIYG